ncbi:hypothetical protein KKB83_04185 [Patescibacteria group bacterium]|nr:hypothetical protein [Patescibacteria group bacterium]
MKKIAIIGFGWVGKSMGKLFPEATIYDPMLKNNVTKEDVNNCDVAFIGVPTPCIEEGRLDTSIVEECVEWCKCPLIVIRSTVNPNDTLNWSVKYNKKIVFQPEYLGETPQHPLLDPKARPFLIIGGQPEARRDLIDLYTEVYNANVTIRQVSSLEAEIIKLSENRAIAFKVAQCQELYDVCEISGVDYYQIRDAVYGDDPRFNLWFTFIYPEKRGMSSKCIPKDVYAWCAFAESLGYNPQITRGILKKNKEWVG